MASFRKPEACGQTVLPDRTILIGQKLVENAEIQKFKCDILGDFQTLCDGCDRVMSRKSIPSLIHVSKNKEEEGVMK